MKALPVSFVMTFIWIASSFAQPPATQPDVVMLDALVNLYQPVPFSHRAHAEMAQMWDGCKTCHHREPEENDQPVDPVHHPTTQDESAKIPACKSCHPVAPEAQVEIHMPSLKGAYHRQCLNCHREWAGENACVMCHAPREGGESDNAVPLPDDIVGRMHPPIEEPKTKQYQARFLPVAGPNVLFRHEAHVKDFGLKCVSCHRHDNCQSCHAPKSATTGSTPVKVARTWKQSHEPCVTCHQDDSCDHCHYQNDQSPPPAFEHARTTQELDEDHSSLKCGDCHPRLGISKEVTCGDSTCHPKRMIAFPLDRPGTWSQPVQPTTTPLGAQPATQPSTRPVIIKIRRGGS